MLYTIENSRGELMIVDGRYDVDAERIRDLIYEHDDHVTARVITHPHPDHVGAFNVIMKNTNDTN